MSGGLQIAECPSCGSGRIERTVRDVVRRHEGQEYVVPAVALHECPDCGEKVYDREAMLKIEAYSPAYNKEKAQRSGGKAGAEKKCCLMLKRGGKPSGMQCRNHPNGFGGGWEDAKTG